MLLLHVLIKVVDDDSFAVALFMLFLKTGATAF
jgi:hypothetical protein